jgi:hypothetical protein
MTEYLPLGLDEITTDLKDFAKTNLGITDTEYEGSNISLLIQLLGYSNLQLNRSMAFGFSEMFLTTAEIRRNVIRLARNNGYEPKRKTSFVYKIRLESNITGEQTLPKFSTFTSGDNTYIYTGPDVTKVFGDIVELNLDSTENAYGYLDSELFGSLYPKTNSKRGSYVITDNQTILEVIEIINEDVRKALLFETIQGNLETHGGLTDLFFYDIDNYKRFASVSAFTVDYTNYSEPVVHIFMSDIDESINPYNIDLTTKLFTSDIKLDFVPGFEGLVVTEFDELEGKLTLVASENKLGTEELYNVLSVNKKTRIAKMDLLEIKTLSVTNGTATATFSEELMFPFQIGTEVTIVGILDSEGSPIEGLNGVLEVTDCTLSSVSWEFTTIPVPEFFLVNASVLDNQPIEFGHTKTFAVLKDIISNRMIDIEVQEGDLVEESQVVIDASILENEYIPVEIFENVEDKGIFITISRINNNDELETVDWVQRNSYIASSVNKEERTFVVVQDEVYPEIYKIYTYFAGTGIKLRVGDVVSIKAVSSKGINGAIQGLMSSNNDVFSVVPYILTSTETINEILLVKGQDEETTEEIRQSSSMFNNSAYRAVTKLDYITICNKQPLVESTQVWGGEELLPNKNPGNVYFSFIPYSRVSGFSNTNNTKFLLQGTNTKELFNIPDSQVLESREVPTSIFNVLKDYKILTLALHDIKPLYLDVDVDIKLVYIYKSLSTSEMNLQMFNTLLSYFRNNLEAFDSSIYYSTIMKYLDRDLGDISGLTLNLDFYLSLSYVNFYKPPLQDFWTIDIPLAFPFEPLFEDDIETFGGTYYYGIFLKENLPMIDTDNFIKFSDRIFMDMDNIVAYDSEGTEQEHIDTRSQKIIIPINYTMGTTTQVGTYTIYNKIDQKEISINFFLDDTTPISITDFYDFKRLKVTLNSQNINVMRNVFPRLNSVNFQ